MEPQPKSDARSYIEQVTELLGPEDAIRKIDLVQSELPPVCALLYRDRPEPGILTAVTYGLSLAVPADPQIPAPELVLAVESADEGWALAAGYVAERFRGVSDFSIGAVLRLDEQLTADSDMCGFVVVPPPGGVLPETLDLPTRQIRFVGVWPLYECEVELIDRIGFPQWRNLRAFNPRDVHRSHVILP